MSPAGPKSFRTRASNGSSRVWQSPRLRGRGQRDGWIGRPVCFLGAVVVGELLAGERAGEALCDFRQHRPVPRLPLGDDSVVDVRAALLEIAALERILDHVEQEGVVEDFEELVVADAGGALPLPFVAPEPLSIDR